LRYSVDTSAILDGWRRYYPPDTFPGLWEKIDLLIHSGDLQATEEVLHELEKKDDDVFEWANTRKAKLFVPIDDDIQPVVIQILTDFEKLVDTRENRSTADPFVIALAKINECTVVTGERATGRKNRPNIPDVCSALGIRSMTLLQMIRSEGWTFG
jgi:hypothetical protein